MWNTGHSVWIHVQLEVYVKSDDCRSCKSEMELKASGWSHEMQVKVIKLYARMLESELGKKWWL